MQHFQKTALALTLATLASATISQQAIATDKTANSKEADTTVTTTVTTTITPTKTSSDKKKEVATEQTNTNSASASEDTEISGASTVVDDNTNNEGDISTGEVEVSKSSSSDAEAIRSIEKGGVTHTTYNLTNYAKAVNSATWTPNMKVNSAMTVKLQALLDWNHASPGPIDGGFGMNTKKALTNFQKIKGLKATGKMDEATWKALTANIPSDQPVLVSYTITQEDANTKFANLPDGAEARSKLKGLYYENIIEMFGERFHMDVAYLKKLNPNKSFKTGETITVINTGKSLSSPITRVVANKTDKTLYAYNGDKLVAAYPTTIGSAATSTPGGTYKIVNKVKMPWYKATVGRDTDSPKTYMLPPGPNSPVGVVWMGLSKPSYGIHGSPVPEGISRQASLGCIRLTNWDVLEVYGVIKDGATVEIK